ncbi:RT0821/Lpp0805 family surface protein [Rhodomicrobium lacus]|jgi:surface antigen|uniref:RT0821/Lpp0805 family surface protein n=1 Tax=Rhodomicrobium TaxID=1068 RepID=UPI000F8E1A86|nr:RT0821/Lpp0805 family surface protein [Rhodomicrobium lacus]WKW49759.1 RT0821/Lpp0805 family surface protein [Rhodomicrobium lacus]
MKKLTLLFASLALAVVSTGCATKEDTGTLLGAGTGALIGNQFGHGGGRVAATVGGALIGGFIGNRIGKSMDDEDRRRAYEAQYAAFNSGQRTEWRNPNNGRYGYVTPRRAYTYQNYQCREFEQTIYIDGRPETMVGKACQQPDGTWREA